MIVNILQNAPSSLPSTAYASWWKRAGAFLLDILFVTVPLALVFTIPQITAWQEAYPLLLRVDGFLSPEEIQTLTTAWIITLIGLLVWLLALFFYFTWMETRWQATPAKKLFHLQTVSIQGQPLSLKCSALRTFIKLLCAATIYPVLLLPLFTRKKQALHDLAAHSVVVQQPF